FGQVGLQDEGARSHVGADLMPHQSAVDEAQRGLCLEAEREMGIEVQGIITAHAQDIAALGLPRFSPPECRGMIERPSRQRHTGGEASLKDLTTTHALGLVEVLSMHREPSPVMVPLMVR